MRVPRIYHNAELLPGHDYELEQQSAHHLTRVLRLKDDDALVLFNGLGGEYNAQLKLIAKKAYATVQQHQPVNRESHLNITLIQGISKGERMDLVIQKSVELGVSRIIPIVCDRTVVNLKADRKEKKIKHWQGILINACEQSGRTAIPQLFDPIMFKDLTQQELPGLKLMLDPHTKQSLDSLRPEHNHINFLIGPEGGLTDDEVEQSRILGFNGIQLGPRILRTETASLTALALSQTLWGDFT